MKALQHIECSFDTVLIRVFFCGESRRARQCTQDAKKGWRQVADTKLRSNTCAIWSTVEVKDDQRESARLRGNKERVCCHCHSTVKVGPLCDQCDTAWNIDDVPKFRWGRKNRFHDIGYPWEVIM